MSDKGWVKIPAKSGIWKAENPGDSLEGKYVDRVSKPFKGRPNWKYCFQSNHPVNVDGKVSFFGTDGLNSAMEDIPKGYDVKIVYKETKPSADPKKQGFKVFDVYVMMSRDDPLYQKLYPEDVDEPVESEKSEGKAAPVMSLKEDVEARNTIDNYNEIFQSEHHGQDPSAEDLIKMAKSDPDMNDEHITRFKTELAAQVKAGKIKSNGGK